MMTARICQQCQESFLATAKAIRLGKGKYCGSTCQRLALPRLPRAGVAERFWSKVDKFGPTSLQAPELGSCWPWTGALSDGYGSFHIGSRRDETERRAKAHVWSYENAHGPVPDGLELDHLCHSVDIQCVGGPTCRHRRCVRPSHLEPVTHRVNSLRGRAPAAFHAQKTHCPRGHPYAGENLIKRAYGSRRCRICTQAREHARYEQRVKGRTAR